MSINSLVFFTSGSLLPNICCINALYGTFCSCDSISRAPSSNFGPVIDSKLFFSCCLYSCSSSLAQGLRKFSIVLKPAIRVSEVWEMRPKPHNNFIYTYSHQSIANVASNVSISLFESQSIWTSPTLVGHMPVITTSFVTVLPSRWNWRTVAVFL
ncbi:hypothetical protein CJ20_163 [Escherichia phage CJ20]|nr:hypothetical protein CJ20_163 [Escherichia phage CJ20]